MEQQVVQLIARILQGADGDCVVSLSDWREICRCIKALAKEEYMRGLRDGSASKL